MPTLPILPGLMQPGPIQPGAQTAPAAPADPAADANAGGAFLDQLAAALASLTPAQPTQPVAAPPQDGVPEDNQDDQLLERSDQPAQVDQAMLDLAASFGLLPLPLLTPLAVTNMPAAPMTGNDQAHTAVPTAARSSLQPAPLLANTVALPPSTSDAAPSVEPAAQEASPVEPPATGDQPTPSSAAPEAPAPKAAAHDVPDVAAAPGLAQADATLSVPTPAPPSVGTMTQSVADHQPRPAADNARADAVPSPDTRAARLPEDHEEPKQAHQAGPITSTPTAHTHIVQQAAAGSETAAGGDQRGRRSTAQHDAGSTAPEPVSTDQSVQPTPFASVAGTAAANATSAAATAHPSDVVAQIAHQAELYRLPGGRGVRIQLHPDGLGGVEVTLRYGAAGALELHVNVEHSSTGALVQAGWSELRDALSQQGISPDRLVMSVSGPSGGGLPSDSNPGGSGAHPGFRSDAGAASFGQSSSQGQPDRQPTPSRTRWSPGVDGASQDPDADTPTSSSRIDLRV